MYATYSLEDDKIRIYYSSRLDDEQYQKAKKLGFQWAPKQGCFFATWTPEREDLAIEFCGEIEAEEIGLAERAEERSERFEGYSDHAQERSNQAYETAHNLVKDIPMGQPILVGHHSETHHRRTLERSDNAMRKSVEESKNASYWAERAQASLDYAAYKEKPAVIVRRIKGLEKDLRTQEKYLKEMGRVENFIQSARLAYPERADEEIKAIAQKNFEGYPKRKARWIDHLNERLCFERARLEAAGGLPSSKTEIKVGDEIRTCFGWWTVLKVNKVTVTAHPHNTHICPWDEKLPFDQILEVKSKEAEAA